MPLEFDEEQILTGRVGHRKRLDPSQIQFPSFEDHHGVSQGTGLVRHLEHHGRAITSGAGRYMIADHREPRQVVWIILDVLGDQIESLLDPGLSTGDRGSTRFFGRQSSGHGRAGGLQENRIGQVSGQPGTALRERLGLAVHLADISPLAAPQQAMMNPQLDVATDLHAHAGKHIQRIGHTTVGRVFDRHDAEIGLPPLHRVEYGRDGCHRNQLRALAELLHGREMTETVFGPKVNNAHGLSQASYSTEPFTKHGLDHGARKGPGIGGDRRTNASLIFCQDFDQGAFRAIGRSPHRFDRAPIQPIEQLVIEPVCR